MTRSPDTLSRNQKSIAILVMDGLLTLLAIQVSLQLRLGEWWPTQYWDAGWLTYLAFPLIGMALSWVMGIPHIVLRSFDNNALFQLGRYAFVMAVIFAAMNTFLAQGFPRSVPGIWGAVFLFFAVFSRLIILEGLGRLQSGDRKNVLIYGAGSTGQRLIAALRASPELRPVAFIDDNPDLRRVSVAGLRVYQPDQLPDLIRRKNVAQVILAMPSVRRSQRQKLLEELQAQQVEVLTLPSFEEMLDGRDLQDQLRPVSPDDLLGRDAVDMRGPEISAVYKDKCILVSGAGGSIGSELSRQIVETGAKRLVLFEQSEYALYAIHQELLRSAGPDVTLVPVLGSVTDPRRVAEVLKRESVDIILHAAAYKHVPLVEDNPLEGARNNVIGTQVIADAAIEAGVERFIHVSTDKAVRPTNVMGATKRLAEMVIQDRQTRTNKTRLTMVRFGNVLGSSGSVIPLFRDQISRGGPVTLTHPEITRYFMTIPEAAQLVLLAGSFATGGEVFVLDMGKPVKIYDLARSLIELSGYTLRDADTPDGDIEIKITGLRPGEKLYEELLIGEGVTPTAHPKIMRAAEGHLSSDETHTVLQTLHNILQTGIAPDIITLMQTHVDGYTPSDTD
ncbi:polysaccharide biosynthesis protein [Halovulum sp. GXIMD14793]